jgi:hypothetical protein
MLFLLGFGYREGRRPSLVSLRAITKSRIMAVSRAPVKYFVCSGVVVVVGVGDSLGGYSSSSGGGGGSSSDDTVPSTGSSSFLVVKVPTLFQVL